MATGLEAYRSGGRLRDYLRTLVATTRWRLAAAVVFAVAGAVGEGAALLLLVPVLGLVGLEVGGRGTGRMAATAKSLFDVVGVRPTMYPVLAVYVAIAVVVAAVQRAQSINAAALQNGFVTELRDRLYRSVAGTTWPFFSRARPSDFTHALTTELERVSTGTQQVLALVATAVVMGVYLSFSVAVSPAATAVAVVGGIALTALLRRRMRRSRDAGAGLTRATRGLYATAIEHMAAQKTTKSFAAEQRSADLFAEQSRAVSEMYVAGVRAQANVRFAYDAGIVVIIAVVLAIAVRVAELRPAETVLLLFIFLRITPKLASVQQSYQWVLNMLPAYSTVTDLTIECEANAEAADHQPGPGVVDRAAQGRPRGLEHGIELRGASYSYRPEGLPLAVRDLDLRIRAGSTTAVVGASGCGKSTTADLVMGLLEPTAGLVLVDGTPLVGEQARRWRRRVGYVGQDTFLFNETIRRNLLWAEPAASDDDLWLALRSASAEDFVRGLPEGIDTVVGDRGMRLSGGERQRVALARALLRGPLLVVLDEATSNLDGENERRIQHAIEQLHGEVTILLITHRLATVKECDVIHVLDEGRLVESGSWDDLVVPGSGRFSALVAAQAIDPLGPAAKAGAGSPGEP